MADLLDQFTSHEVHEVLREARVQADSVLAALADGSDGDEREFAEAIVAALRLAATELAGLDGRLVDPALLTSVQNGLESVSVALSEFEGSPDSALIRAHGEATAMLRNLGNLPVSHPETATALADQAAQLLEAETQRLMADLKGLQESIATSVGQSETLASEIAARLDDHETDLAAANAALEQESSAFTGKADEARTALDVVKNEIAELRVTHETAYQDAVTAYELWESTAQTRLDGDFKKVEELNAQAAEMLLNASGAALGTSWKKQANRHFWERVAWTVGILAMLIGSVILAFHTLEDLTAPTGSSFVEGLVFYIPRIPFAVVTITILGFAVQQAARRAQFEARDQRVGNELSALPTFLERVPDTSREELARQIALNYFPGTKLENDLPPPSPQAQPLRLWGLSQAAWAGIGSNAALAAVALYALTR